MPITNVADAMREVGRSRHIRTREQAIAVGLQAQRASGRRSGRRTERQSRAAGARRSGRR